MDPDIEDAAADRPPAKLADDVFDRILADILAGRLAGGVIIQERRLALALGVSRSPLRDALGRLEGEGLLTRLSPRLLGVRVVTLTDYVQALDVRALVEPSAAALAAAQLAPAELADLQREQRRLEAQPGLPAEAHWAFDDRLHEALGAAGGNGCLAGTIRGLRRWTTIHERRTTRPGDRPGTEGHRAILDGLAARDAPAAATARARHIAAIRAAALAGY
jgi:DNA-binding GntR family transcriptional regulator